MGLETIEGPGALVADAVDKGDRRVVAVVLKATKLMEIMTERKTEWTLGDLSTESGYPASSTHRILATLEQAGWVVRRGSKYAVSLRVTELSGRVLGRLNVRGECRQVMESLSKSTGETAYLVIREGEYAVCIERVEGDHSIRVMAWSVGSTLPLFAGAAPLALSAQLDEAEIGELFRPGSTWELPIGRMVTTEEIRAKWDQARVSGWVFSEGETYKNIASIGVPVFDASGRAVAGMSIGGLASDFAGARRQSLVRVVASAGEEASRLLGYVGKYPRVRSTGNAI